jgi:spore coat protein H
VRACKRSLLIVLVALAVTTVASGVRAACPSDREPLGVRLAPGWELFAGTNVPAFTLELAPDALQSLRDEPRQWVRGTLQVAGQTFQDVGVHIKGSEGSLQPVDRRPSLTVSLNKFVPGQKLFGLRKIHFNNTAEDPSFMTQVICTELYRQAGVPAARSAHATLKLNNRSLGLYVVVEGLTKEFLAQYFRRTDGVLYDGGFQQDITTPFECIGGTETKAQPDRLALVAAAREADPARRWSRLGQTLDTERFISLLAMTTLTWNWDGYPMAYNNYRIYHDPERDRMTFMPHGLDQMFWEAGGPMYPPFKGLLARAVMQVPEARHRYRERLAVLHTNVFRVEVLNRRVEELTDLITPYRPSAPQQAARLKQLIMDRALAIGAQLKQPEPLTLLFTNNGASVPGWSPASARAGVRQTVGPVPGVARALRIMQSEATTSSSAVPVWLPAGEYEFVGRVRVVQFSTNENERPGGADLRVAGAARSSSRRLLQAADWESLRCRFWVRLPEQPVELVCEVRNAVGEVWFDLASLRVERVVAGGK